MPFSIDFLDDGRALEWEATADGAVATERDDYTPRFYVGRRDPETDIELTTLQSVYDQHPDVVATETVSRRPGFRRDEETVLAVDVAHIDRVTPLARQARQLSAYPVGDLACFNVDFSRVPVLSGERRRSDAGERAVDTPAQRPGDRNEQRCLWGAVRRRRHRHRLADGYPDRRPGSARSTRSGRPYLLDKRDRPDPPRDGGGRRRRRLLAKSVAGRRLPAACEPVDVLELRPRRSLAGAVQRARPGDHRRVEHVLLRGDEPRRRPRPRVALEKPVQELAWASIGNVLTAIQICEAHDRGVLVPWNSWRHEFYKPMGTLHDADRGGFIFAPEVGLHENVHELDFSSLYPNIICTRNVSPDVIRCSCHSDRDDVPGLGYSICDDRGYLVDVLQPIIDARDEIKAAIRREKKRDEPDEDRLAELEGRSGALKWILVACFGYQGFSNAKFGRIECHEAINAFAREILLMAKQRLETGAGASSTGSSTPSG